ncbi:Aste57867_21698 [Aphanomyces stellatus]|uniref:Aste57867_21698 protein n=1 Tax=Aphanomyces stellatus TaxID=120398 RepID=A0A485LKA3_9STRA|nr:hypothetical protein As57867_021629 [Aphanomyces stellatus]VFT98367.1 Aste57867_21698 [Aphanomyces stellatus]
MIRQFTNIVSAGGFSRLGRIHRRIAEHYPSPVVDTLMRDGVVRPTTTPKLLCILTSACTPDAGGHIDLRELHSGVQHAMQLSLDTLFSPSMMAFAANDGRTADEDASAANDRLQEICSPRLHKNLIGFVERQVKASKDWRAVPQPIDHCAIIDAMFEEHDEGDQLTFCIAVTAPFTTLPYEKEPVDAVVDDPIMPASKGFSASAPEPPAADDGDATTSALPDGELQILASFKTNVRENGELDWKIDDMLITGLTKSST